MSLDYIRKAYGVPAERGGRVEYTGDGSARLGTISGASGSRIRIRLDGETRLGLYHPTWELRYLTPIASLAEGDGS
jgi:hypothetical protein